VEGRERGVGARVIALTNVSSSITLSDEADKSNGKFIPFGGCPPLCCALVTGKLRNRSSPSRQFEKITLVRRVIQMAVLLGIRGRNSSWLNYSQTTILQKSDP
jgi:hypothetical protein